jgi:cytidylate kinase
MSDVDAVLRAVQRRDTIDSTRAVSPLRPAEDAVVLDTTTLDTDAVLDRVRELAAARGLIVLTVRSSP